MMMRRKPRILCLHGLRTSGQIMKKMMGKWPPSLLKMFDFNFPDAPFPAKAKSDVEGLYDPPYYEWYQWNEVESWKFDECIAFIQDYMITHGPFDGVLGFSQGGMLASVLPWMQREGVAFTQVPKIKFVIIISGFKLILKSGPPKLLVNVFETSVDCPSLHFIGDKDFLKKDGLTVIKSYVNPFVIYHTKGHTIPKLDEKGLETMFKFIEKIQDMFWQELHTGFGPKAAL